MAVRHETVDNESPEKVGIRWTVRNPHPEFGSNSNIINEYGHTRYPKFIDHPSKKRVDAVTTYVKNGDAITKTIETDFPEQVLVNSEEEEKALYAKFAPKDKAWDKAK